MSEAQFVGLCALAGMVWSSRMQVLLQVPWDVYGCLGEYSTRSQVPAVSVLVGVLPRSDVTNVGYFGACGLASAGLE